MQIAWWFNFVFVIVNRARVVRWSYDQRKTVNTVATTTLYTLYVYYIYYINKCVVYVQRFLAEKVLCVRNFRPLDFGFKTIHL